MLRRFSAEWRRRLVSEINASQRTLRGVLQPIKWAWPQWRNMELDKGVVYEVAGAAMSAHQA
jgi:hypothetical protein